MRRFKTKPFARFAEREGMEDAALCDAVRRIDRGQIDADLGGGVMKQRIARKGQGRSGTASRRATGRTSGGTS